MRNLIKILLVLFVFVLPGVLKAQIAQQKLTLYNWNMAISDDFRLEMQSLDLDDMVNVVKTGQLPFEKMMGDSCWAILTQALNSKGALVQAKNSFEGKLFHNSYGFPMGGKKKAAKMLKDGLLVRVDIQMYPSTTSETKASIVVYEKEKKKMKPTITVKVTVFDRKLNKLVSAKGKHKAKDWIIVEARELFGVNLNETRIDEESETLISIYRKAVKQVLEKIK